MELHWRGQREGYEDLFDVEVPGNIQRDYAGHMGWGDINWGNNFRKYSALEDSAWLYHATFDAPKMAGERLFFVTKGIDYEYEVFLNGESLAHHEGMFTAVELDITSRVRERDNVLTVRVFPHPKSVASPVDRTQANHSVKPPVSYEWDWHPRVIPSGLWNDTGIELRAPGWIGRCEVTYELDDDMNTARVHVEVECDREVTVALYDPEGREVYSGAERDFCVKNPELWWCAGQGEQKLYRWEGSSGAQVRTGRVGFRKVELVMNAGAWEEVRDFPKSRSTPPITLQLNGRKIFCKGSNFVSPEIFSGTLTRDTYIPLVTLAREANMNIFRMWGGSGIQKEPFYELCDEMGIMVWQEFPLACNNYPNDKHYLAILEQEAVSIVHQLRPHPSLVIWCGGNELFNDWSGMTDQSHALRLLNKLCYEHDRNTPFLATSPLMGMGHGCYLFYHDGQEVYEMFQKSHCTAYTEFGVPSVPDEEYLKTFIPPEELFPPKEGSTWHTHHAFRAWTENAWLCMDVLERYFGTISSLSELCQRSAWLQCEGYKAIFEEARRQKPHCSMAINWCYNEPWKTAANNTLLCYPAKPKKAYYAVRDSLRDVVASAKFPKFSYAGGECFEAELWLLNDAPKPLAGDTVSAFIDIGTETMPLTVWQVEETGAGENARGPKVSVMLPDLAGVECFTLRLVRQNGEENRYTLHYRAAKG